MLIKATGRLTTAPTIKQKVHKMMKQKNTTRYTIKLNHRARTYTIRRYDNGKVTAKYRSYAQGSEFSEHWTEDDIKNFLRYSNDYYIIS